MKKSFELSFSGTKFLVPKRSLFDFFEYYPHLIKTTSYEVRSRVPLEVFQVFVKSLETNTKVPITNDNVASISLLAREFCCEELLSECSSFSRDHQLESISALSSRFSEVDRRISDALEVIVSALLKTCLPGVPMESPRERMEIPYITGRPLDGIIAHLTRKYAGNVHDKRVVDITSSSVEDDNPEFAAKNVANFTDASHFGTKNLSDSWLALDFKRMRIIPTHYAMVTFHDVVGVWTACHPHSWVLEGADEEYNWTVLDEHTHVSQLDGADQGAIFEISRSMECRCIRLISKGSSGSQPFALELYAFEIFGTLLQ
jgi:hypothetical protein